MNLSWRASWAIFFIGCALALAIAIGFASVEAHAETWQEIYLHGTVTWDDGEPIHGAEIVFYQQDNRRKSGATRRTKSDNGTFLLGVPVAYGRTHILLPKPILGCESVNVWGPPGVKGEWAVGEGWIFSVPKDIPLSADKVWYGWAIVYRRVVSPTPTPRPNRLTPTATAQIPTGTPTDLSPEPTITGTIPPLHTRWPMTATPKATETRWRRPTATLTFTPTPTLDPQGPYPRLWQAVWADALSYMYQGNTIFDPIAEYALKRDWWPVTGPMRTIRESDGYQVIWESVCTERGPIILAAEIGEDGELGDIVEMPVFWPVEEE